ncbi:unnamed protein product [Phaeothamnion confervicola]
MIMGRRKFFLEEAVAALRKEGIQAAAFVGDVRSEENAEAAVAATVSAFGSLSILVNGAAGNFLANASDLKTKGFKTVMDIDAVGVFNMCRAAFPALKATGGDDGASIVNVSATLHYAASRFQVHASAAKAAIDSITRTLALEWGEYGIRVNGVAPGPIAGTPGMAKLAPGSGGATELVRSVREKIPVGRLGETRDIGMACVFLCSPAAASYVSGHTLCVDGGEWLCRPALMRPEQVRMVSRAIEASSRAIGVGGGGGARSKL